MDKKSSDVTDEVFLAELTKALYGKSKVIIVASISEDNKVNLTVKGSILNFGELLANLVGHFISLSYTEGNLATGKSLEVFNNLVKTYVDTKLGT